MTEVQDWGVMELRPYAENPRNHPEIQITRLAESIRTFGFRVPILATSDGEVVAGHGRLEAAKRAGLTRVPVIIADGMTDEEVKAFRLADNRLAEMSEWNLESLESEINTLAETGYDLDVTGFDAAGILETLGGGPKPDPVSEEKPLPEDVSPTAKLGDLYALGDHRLICGDCTDPAVVARLLNGVVPPLMVTDPPWGVEYKPGWREKSFASKVSQDVLENDDIADWQPAWDLFPGDVAYIWHGASTSAEMLGGLYRSRFEFRAQIIWAKPAIVVSRGHYNYRHEPCFYMVRKGGKSGWVGAPNEDSIWQIPTPPKSQNTRHPTQKPVECMARPMRNSSNAGDVVYDPFLGSGSSLIAAEQMGRVCYGVDISPVYVDLCIARWEHETGGTAVKIEDNA